MTRIDIPTYSCTPRAYAIYGLGYPIPDSCDRWRISLTSQIKGIFGVSHHVEGDTYRLTREVALQFFSGVAFWCTVKAYVLYPIIWLFQDKHCSCCFSFLGDVDAIKQAFLDIAAEARKFKKELIDNRSAKHVEIDNSAMFEIPSQRYYSVRPLPRKHYTRVQTWIHS